MEKLLKAFLLYKKNNYPFVHSINKLIDLCVKIDRDFEYLLKINADFLEDYYTGVRYPPLLRVSEEEAREAIKIAEKVKEFVLKKLEERLQKLQ